MRLHGYLKKSIKALLYKSYNNAEIIVFGSRVDDNKKGGDIDIAIKTNMSSDDFNQRKINFLTSMMRKELDLKIDLVQYHDSMNDVLKLEIQRHGELL